MTEYTEVQDAGTSEYSLLVELTPGPRGEQGEPGVPGAVGPLGSVQFHDPDAAGELRGVGDFLIDPTNRQLLIFAGSAANPSLGFLGNVDTGLHYDAGLVLGVGGVDRLTLAPNGQIYVPESSGTAAPRFSLADEPGTGFSVSYGYPLSASFGGYSVMEVYAEATLSDLAIRTAPVTTAFSSIGAYTNTAPFGHVMLQSYASAATGDRFGLPKADTTFLVSNGATGGLKIGTVGAAPLVLGTSDLPRLTIAADGSIAALGAMSFAGQILAADGTALLPAYSFSSDPNTGMYSAGADILGFSVAGAARLTFPTASGMTLESGTFIPATGAAQDIGATTSTGLWRNVHTMGDLTNYNVFTDTLNYERFRISWSGNVAVIRTEALGTGTLRAMLLTASGVGVTGGSLTMNTAAAQILAQVGDATLPGVSFSGDPDTGMYRNAANDLAFATGGVARWHIASYDWLPFATSTNDIGSAALRLNGLYTNTAYVYSEYVDALNYSRLRVLTSGTSSFIQQEVAGTGAIPNLTIGTATGAGLLYLRVNNQSRAALTTAVFQLKSDISLAWSAGVIDATSDTILLRDAANVLAMRNGTTAQGFRAYNTYTDASNYERLGAYWSGNAAFILTELLGTGTARALTIGTQGAADFTVRTTGIGRWSILSNGHFIALLDNSYDIGASGATRPRSVFIGSNLTAGGVIRTGDGSAATPSYSFGSASNNGLSLPVANTIITSVAGTARSMETIAQIQLKSDMNLAWSGGNVDGAVASDVILLRDAANVLAMRNGATAQGFRVYGDYTDASNYGRLRIAADATNFYLLSEAIGTGALRNFNIGTVTASNVSFMVTNSVRWTMNGSGVFSPGTTDTNDLGAVASRVRDLYQRGGLYNYNNTDTTNYERLFVGFSANAAFLVTQAAGTGVVRPMIIGVQGSTSVSLYTNSTSRWQVDSSGHFSPWATDSYDFGAPTTRIRNVYQKGFTHDYGAFTDTSNYERLEIGSGLSGLAAADYGILQRSAGTGTARELYLGTIGSSILYLMTANTRRWSVTATGMLTPFVTGTYTFGTTGARIAQGFLGGNTVVVSTPMLDLAQTWNDGAVTFYGALVNVTNTASATNSRLISLQVGGVEQFSVTRIGDAIAVGSVSGVNGIFSGFAQIAAGSPLIFNGRSRIYAPAANAILIADSVGTGGAYLESKEIADPTAPAADSGRLYFRDNGAGKTQLCVRFPTGAVQVVATEP